ncbi:MAG TPA: asparagine synthase-related protein [Aliidongia sp.]|uniref:asparagine synthetase B family protein n=1 Tax=Aliidongia sp. TaxID=1914230 RepID=UPI002DDCEB88|nr:asparagine synthase-related protein [Aliidongia sp.]HEV2675999.1 asparagine synthase-related protein [Aliidongia sp.]
MSGIGGFQGLEGRLALPEAVARLSAALAVRGAGEASVHEDGVLVLVHRQPTDIDRRPVAQPFVDPRGAVLVGDGALDPAPLQLYRAYGIEFARHLRGGGALALYDPATGRLLLARDGFGIKPLYYAETDQGFVFASTTTALIATGLIQASVLSQARNELLQLQFTTGRTTPFAGIHRMLPGETLIVEQGRVVDRRLYRPLPAVGPLPIAVEPALLALDGLLDRAVGRHGRAEGPIGLFLTGSVESIALLAGMAAQGAAPVEALSLTYSQPTPGSDIELVRTVAAAVGARLTEVPFREADFWHLLPEVAAAIDDPMADVSLVPQWKLACVAAEAGFRTIFSGEGGDELFGGYGRYRSLLRPWWAGGRVPRTRGAFDGLAVLRAPLPGWRDGIVATDAAQGLGTRTRLQMVQAADCQDWLPNDLLARFDRCLAAHGLDGRLPLLDREIALFAFGLPDTLKIRDGVGKWLLRRWLDQRLPSAAALSRRRSDAIPIGAWLRRRGAMLGPLVARQDGLREICRPDAVERLFAKIENKRQVFAAWNLLFYALWHRAHVEGLAHERDVFQTLSGHGRG